MGAGLWIWRISRCEQGDVEAIAARAATVGLTHVLVKVADGSNGYNGTAAKALCEALRIQGVKPWAWSYTYGDDPEEEATVFARRALECEVIGLAVDAEGDRYTNSASRATRFMTRLRNLVGTSLHISLSTHRFPTNHPTLPIAAFMRRCDSAMPQAYYIHQGPGLIAQLERVKREWDAYKKPIIMTGAAYPEGLGPDEQDIVRLADWSRAHGIEQFNWWSYEHATPAMWEKIQQAAVEE